MLCILTNTCYCTRKLNSELVFVKRVREHAQSAYALLRQGGGGPLG